MDVVQWIFAIIGCLCLMSRAGDIDTFGTWHLAPPRCGVHGRMHDPAINVHEKLRTTALIRHGALVRVRVRTRGYPRPKVVGAWTVQYMYCEYTATLDDDRGFSWNATWTFRIPQQLTLADYDRLLAPYIPNDAVPDSESWHPGNYVRVVRVPERCIDRVFFPLLERLHAFGWTIRTAVARPHHHGPVRMGEDAEDVRRKWETLPDRSGVIQARRGTWWVEFDMLESESHLYMIIHAQFQFGE